LNRDYLAPPLFSKASTTSQVRGSTTPSTVRLKFCCNFLTAVSVLAPKRPSTPPLSKPTALIRLCRGQTGKPVEPVLGTGWLWSASSMLIHVTRRPRGGSPTGNRLDNSGTDPSRGEVVPRGRDSCSGLHGLALSADFPPARPPAAAQRATKPAARSTSRRDGDCRGVSHSRSTAALCWSQAFRLVLPVAIFSVSAASATRRRGGRKVYGNR
jgi:hypothetical protein